MRSEKQAKRGQRKNKQRLVGAERKIFKEKKRGYSKEKEENHKETGGG